MDIQKLKDFIRAAADATYAGGGKPEENPQRPDFIELVYEDEEFSYRDSYTGHSRSMGQEVVRYKGKPVWASGYGGGMVEGKENLSEEAFSFLKKALSAVEEGFEESMRGPHNFEEGDWKYVYEQKGDLTDFYGYEAIYFKGEHVFFHHAIGQLIKHD
jgi:hypothetical protein